MDEKKYKVIISGSARQMLVSHAAFLANVNEKAAERLVEEFEAAARSLEIMPMRHPYISSGYLPASTYRRFVFGKRYLMIYQVKEYTVYVDYVIDCRQGYGWLLD